MAASRDARPKGSKVYGATAIPEDIQGPMRTRLRLLRQVRKLHINQVTSLGMGTLGNYEVHNIATLRLGDAFALAEEYQMTPRDFFNFLFGDDVQIRSAKTRDAEELLLYVRDAPPEVQSLLLTLVKAAVSHYEATKINDIASTARVRMSSRRSRGVKITEE